MQHLKPEQQNKFSSAILHCQQMLFRSNLLLENYYNCMKLLGKFEKAVLKRQILAGKISLTALTLSSFFLQLLSSSQAEK